MKQNNFVNILAHCILNFGMLVILVPSAEPRLEGCATNFEGERPTRLSRRTSAQPQIVFGDEDQRSDELQFPQAQSNDDPCFGRGSQKCLNKYYLDEATHRYYVGGSKGPCPNHMVFDLMADSMEEVKGQCHCKESGNKKRQRTLVQDSSTGKCFPLFTQGPCKDGEWLTLDEKLGKIRCDTNPCLAFELDVRFSADASDGGFVLFNNRCVWLGSSAVECDPNQTIQFIPGICLPICASEADFENYAFGAISRGRCRRGSSRSPLGKCVKNFVWT